MDGVVEAITGRERRRWSVDEKLRLVAEMDRGGDRAAAMYSLIITAKPNDADRRAWLADVQRRINDYPASRLHELLR